jgi:HD-GYP domain-containing protein (c-di-GMP phosphodiesterase class II)
MDAIKDSLKIKIQALKIHHVPLSIAIGYEIKSNLESNSKDTIKIAENIMYKRKLVEGRSMRNHAIQGILKTLTDKYIDEKTHSERVSQICQAIGNAMGMNKDDVQELKMAGLLHDIGKISIPDAILDKTSSLTQDEYAIIKTHPEISYQILRAADEYSDLATYALSHHERFDGKGYPKGLKGEKIPLFSRIIAVADAYEAMTANRPYRKALSSSFAQSELQKNANTQFDGSIVTVFLSILNSQPNL